MSLMQVIASFVAACFRTKRAPETTACTERFCDIMNGTSLVSLLKYSQTMKDV